MAKIDNVIIVGAGPAGLTAGYELIKKGYQVTILEKSPNYIGGISRTVEYKGYRFDIGGHRFFSKNNQVMEWWYDILKDDFLQRPRLSRWYYQRKFFHYPIQAFELLRVFGVLFAFKITFSYFKSKLQSIKPENNLADWCINNFGYFLAKPFFIDYNKKLWGINADQISKDFAVQRIKGLSFMTAIKDILIKIFNPKAAATKSLIKTFNYPKYGPGQLWEKVADFIKEKGGTIIMNADVTKILYQEDKFTVETVDQKNYVSNYLLSTMPLRELIPALRPTPPSAVINAAKALHIRDFITVALMFENITLPKDNWIYTHDEGISAIRIQLFKNWSPYMVPDKNKSCIAFEYVTKEGENLWQKSDEELTTLAINELNELKLLPDGTKPIDTKVVKLKNVYPRYDLGYDKHLKVIKDYLSTTFTNKQLQPIGRAGLHRYNNSDHSMMTAFLAVRNIIEKTSFDPWNVNSEANYHEKKKQLEI